MKFPVDFSIQGKTIKVMSDGCILLSNGYYELSFDNLEKAVKLARKLKSTAKTGVKNE